MSLSRDPDVDLRDAPTGTKAPSIIGGHWYKMPGGGWKWNGPNGTGGIFPRPGGDWDGVLIHPPKPMNQRDTDGEQGDEGVPVTLPDETRPPEGTLGYPRLTDETYRRPFRITFRRDIGAYQWYNNR